MLCASSFLPELFDVEVDGLGSFLTFLALTAGWTSAPSVTGEGDVLFLLPILVAVLSGTRSMANPAVVNVNEKLDMDMGWKVGRRDPR